MDKIVFDTNVFEPDKPLVFPKKENLLIVPNEQDIFDASRIQLFPAMERKKEKGGKAPKRSAKINKKGCNQR
ncbi:MAG: hypothetical protein ACR2N3_10335 [Pyrinomonadaceae bacterium]